MPETTPSAPARAHGPAASPAPSLVERLPALLGGITLAAGALALLGWATGTTALVGIGPGGSAVLPNTAAAFAALGAALWLLRERPTHAARARRAAAGLLGAAVALFGIAVVQASLRGVPLWLDTVLFAEQVRLLPWRPTGRIAINTAVAFTLLGVAVATLAVGGSGRAERRVAPAFARGCAALALLVAYLGLVGYAYGVQQLYRLGTGIPGGMALATALALVVASLGALAVRPTRGFAALVLADDAGGVLARRLVPAAVIVPVGLGLLLLAGRRAELMERESGIAQLVIAVTVVFLLLIASAARTVRAYDAERGLLLTREREARREADLASRAKSEFLATMSHELRTPLNAIAGYTELLSLGLRGPVTGEQLTDLERIRRAQRHLLGLVNDVLNIAKLESGRLDLRLAAVPAGEVLREVEALVGALVQQKALTLAVDAGPPSLRARADREKVLQVLLNLLSNAIKHTPAGGAITVAASAPTPDRVAVTVADSGPGIPAGDRERIFEPFVQLRSTRAPGAPDGTGLGLAISRELARAMGGDLLVESAEGAGATFTLALPADAS